MLPVKTTRLAIFILTVLLISSLGYPYSLAIAPSQKLVPENDVTLQKVVLNMHIPSNPKLPFGCVWGTVKNAAPGYPVEIEIYKNEKPVYFAQTDVGPDGSYQQYFRVINTEDGHIQHIFEGDYTVEVFKYVVANSTADSTQA